MAKAGEKAGTHEVLLDPRTLFGAFASLIVIQATVVISLNIIAGTTYPAPAPIIITMILALMVGVVTDRVDALLALRVSLPVVTLLATFFPAAAPTAPNLQVFLGVVFLVASVVEPPRRYAVGASVAVAAVLVANLIRLARGTPEPNPVGATINLTLGLAAAAMVYGLLDREQRRVHQRLQDSIARASDAVEALEHATRAKGRYLANMSHELRTPMNAILGYAELLQDDVDQRHHQPLEQVLRAGKQLLGDIDDVLDRARREARGEVDVDTEQIAGLTSSSAAPWLQPAIDLDDAPRQRRLVERMGMFVLGIDAAACLMIGVTGAVWIPWLHAAVAAVGVGVMLVSRAGHPQLASAGLAAGGAVVLALGSALAEHATKIEVYAYFLVALLALSDRRAFVIGASVVAGLMLPAQVVRYLQGWTSLPELTIAVNAILMGSSMIGFMVHLQAQKKAMTQDSALRTEQALDQAHRLDNARSMLVTEMSHRLRTPLTTVVGYAELLEEDLPGEFRDDLDRIRRAALHLCRIVDDVTDMTELEHGSTRFQPVPTDPEDICTTAADLCRSGIEQGGNTLEVDVGFLPDQVRWDPDLIRQILVNLLTNAGKFTTDGHITLTAATDGVLVHIAVTDDGRGISEPDQLRLFNAFERAVGTTVEGTGLGLAISRRLAELHGGTLEVSSTLGEGSRFTLSLPRGVG